LVSVMAAGVVLGTAPVAAAAEPGRVEFDILRNGRVTGTHSVEVTKVGDVATARVRIDMAGRIGPIAFSYTHRCMETWRGALLQALDCTDQEGGKAPVIVRAIVKGGGLEVSGAGAAVMAPAGIAPCSWWRASLMRQSQMIDTRTGKLTPLAIQRVGESSVATAAGPVMATHYRLRGKSNADVWYDAQGRWVRLTYKAGGQTFEYRLKSPLANAPRA
jgi:hypothetical protein